MAAATNRIPDKCPRFKRLFVMVLQPGKVFLLAKYRHHDERAVRKREASVDICRVSDRGPCRGSLCCTENPPLKNRRSESDYGFCSLSLDGRQLPIPRLTSVSPLRL